MKLTLIPDGSALEAKVEGRLDTTTAPALEKEMTSNLSGVTTLVLDFEKLEYISSAGLRVVLSLQKQMNKQGRMIVRGVNEAVMEVFTITGFADILTIEDT